MRITSGSTAIVRAMHSRCCWPPESPTPGSAEPVLDLVPQAGAAQRPLDPVLEVDAAGPAQPQAGGDVVEDRHRRERVGLLEDHADDAAHRRRVDRRAVDVGVVERHRALGARARDLLVHAVDAAHERRLPAARGADHGRHLVRAVDEVDALDGVRRPRRRRAGRAARRSGRSRPPARGSAARAVAVRPRRRGRGARGARGARTAPREAGWSRGRALVRVPLWGQGRRRSWRQAAASLHGAREDGEDEDHQRRASAPRPTRG